MSMELSRDEHRKNLRKQAEALATTLQLKYNKMDDRGREQFKNFEKLKKIFVLLDLPSQLKTDTLNKCLEILEDGDKFITQYLIDNPQIVPAYNTEKSNESSTKKSEPPERLALKYLKKKPETNGSKPILAPPRPVSAHVVSPLPRPDPDSEGTSPPSVPIGRPGPSSRYAKHPERARPAQEFIRLGPKPPASPKHQPGPKPKTIPKPQTTPKPPTISMDSIMKPPPPPKKPKPKKSVSFVEIPIEPSLPQTSHKRPIETRDRRNSETVQENEAVPVPKKVKTEAMDEIETVYDAEQLDNINDFDEPLSLTRSTLDISPNAVLPDLPVDSIKSEPIDIVMVNGNEEDENVNLPEVNEESENTEIDKFFCPKVVKTEIVTYPGGLPIPTTVKIEPNLFHDFFADGATKETEHFCYAFHDDDVWFMCLIGECCFITCVTTEMEQHAVEHDEKWDNFCKLCESHIECDETSLLAEFSHLTKVHARLKIVTDHVKSNAPQIMLTVKKFASEIQPVLFSSEIPPKDLNDSRPEVLNILKPWSKKECDKLIDYCEEMLEDKSLYAFYKCLGINCSFTTTTLSKFEEHLENHEREEICDDLKKNWLECPYCENDFQTINAYIDHLNLIHIWSKYQCRYCLYRARESKSVEIHQQCFHLDRQEDIQRILVIENQKQLMKDGNEAPDLDNEDLHKISQKNVPALKCQLCRRQFYIIADFISHLRENHDESNVICFLCSKVFPIDNIANHCSIGHLIGVFECIYCTYGTNDKNQMIIHLSRIHASQKMICCVRHTDKDFYDKASIYDIQFKNLASTLTDPLLFLHCPYTDKELDYKLADL